MSDLAADEAIRLIEAASGPADLFGSQGGADASRRYRRLARLTHPDARAHPDAPATPEARATRAFARLAELWAQHQGTYGPLMASGDIANFYPVGTGIPNTGLLNTGLLKLPRDPADNDLMQREADALTQIQRTCDKRFSAYFPRLIRAQSVQDPRSGIHRRGNIIGKLDGFRSLAEVRSAFPGGVDPRDAAWMWRRLLVAIGAAHRAGVIHGAVLPEHVLIHPGEHGLVLVDWCYSSGRYRGGLPAIVRRYRGWYPPEVLAGGPTGPDTDIWLATRCMTELVGRYQPTRLAAFAAGCLLANPSRRPQDAWRLLSELDELLERLYGPRTFRPFAIPDRG